jgi:alanyl aminopeptidase
MRPGRSSWPWLVAAALAALELHCGSGSPSGARTSAPAAADPGHRPSGARLPDWALPRRYRIHFFIDPNRDRFQGQVTIELDVTRPTATLVVHSQDLVIEEARLRQGAWVTLAHVHQDAWTASSTPSGTTSRASAAPAGTAPADELWLRLPRPASLGPAELTIAYTGELQSSKRGLLKARGGALPYVFSDFEPAGARSAFPCFDEPAFKVPVQLTVTVPFGKLAVANTPVQARTRSTDGRSWTYRFRETPPLPTYLVAVAAGSFEIVQGSTQPVPVRVVAPLGKGEAARRALRIAEQQLGVAVRLLGSPFPFAKLDLLGVPTLPFGVAMEHPGLVTIHNDFMYVGAQDSSGAQAEQERIIAHELAHMWFGNLVTLAWWNDTWLNEGLATWMESKVCSLASRECNGEASSSAQKAHVMRLDVPPTAKPVRKTVPSAAQAAATFDEFAYLKGMSLIRMTEHWVGQETLLTGLRNYLARHRWQSVRTPDLLRALSAASSPDIGPVLSSFLDRPGLPLLRFGLRCRTDATAGTVQASLQVSQRPYALVGQSDADGGPWTVPVCARFDAGSTAQRQCWVLRDATAELELDTARCPFWLWPNAHDAGYYHFEVDRKWLRSLVRDNAELSEPERVGLVANLWALVRAGRLQADEYLRLLRHFSNEQSRQAWDEVIGSLRELERLVRAPTRPAFALYVRELLGPAARRIGAVAQPDEPREHRMLRASLLLALGSLGDDGWARSQAAPLAERWLEAPHSVDPDLAAAAIVVHAREGGPQLAEKLVEVIYGPGPARQRHVAQRALSALEQPASLERVLKLGLARQGANQRTTALYRALFERPAARDFAYAWIERHLSRVMRQLRPENVEQLVGIVSMLCQVDRVRHATRLLGPYVAGQPRLEQALQRANAVGEQCAALAAEQAPRIERYLQTAGSAPAGSRL